MQVNVQQIVSKEPSMDFPRTHLPVTRALGCLLSPPHGATGGKKKLLVKSIESQIRGLAIAIIKNAPRSLTKPTRGGRRMSRPQ